MRTPIAHTLGWPARIATTGQRLDLSGVLSMQFEPVDSLSIRRVSPPLLWHVARYGQAWGIRWY